VDEVMVTVCVPVYVPATGLNVGVAAWLAPKATSAVCAVVIAEDAFNPKAGDPDAMKLFVSVNGYPETAEPFLVKVRMFPVMDSRQTSPAAIVKLETVCRVLTVPATTANKLETPLPGVKPLRFIKY
jgi:hypothetical protein